MMREIKFRAWDGERIRESFLIHQANGMPCTINDDVIETHQDWVLEQYTGLKDKNGVEIYEGDVVESDFYEPHIGGIVAIVDYRPDELAFTFVNSRGDINGEQDAFKYGGLKVIGNIHQNPELINA